MEKSLENYNVSGRCLKKKIMDKIKKKESGCWEWIGAVHKKKYGNYGQLRIGTRGNSKLFRAHRVSYEVFVGKIGDGLEIDHLCHNTLCVNPDHLEEVTHNENMQRRKDSHLEKCKHGHTYTEKTTYIRPDNHKRECLLCRKLRRKH